MATLAQPNFDSIIATTLQRYNKMATSQILNNTVIWYKLKERGRITNWDGGRSIVESLVSEDNNTIKMIRDYEGYNLSPQEGITAAEWFAKQMVGVIAISGIEEALNSGNETKVIDLLDTKGSQLDDSYMKKLGEFSFKDGSADGGRHFQGLDIIAESGTGSAWSVYGTIDRGAADGSGDFFRNYFSAAGSTFTLVGLAQLRKAYNTLTIGNDAPDLAVTHLDIYDNYETQLYGKANFDMLQTRYDKRLGDAGFAALLIKDVPLIHDPYITGLTDGAGTSEGGLSVLMLNTRYISFKALRGRNMQLTDFVRPANQDARYAARLFYGNFTCNAPYGQGRILFTAV